MRITQTMLSNTMLRNLNSSLSRMDRIQDMLSTGRKISKPSHDPVVAVRGMLYRTTEIENRQFRDNTDHAVSWLNATEDAIAEGNNILARVKELVTQAANDTLNEGDREKIRYELMQLRGHLGNVANTTMGGSYLFSGTDTDIAPFQGGQYTNQNNDDIVLQLSRSIELPINVSGMKLFAEPQGNYGKSIFGLLDSMIQDLSPYETNAQGQILAANANGEPIFDPSTGKIKIYDGSEGQLKLEKGKYMFDSEGYPLAAKADGTPEIDGVEAGKPVRYTGQAGQNFLKNDGYIMDAKGYFLAADTSGQPIFDSSAPPKVEKYDPDLPGHVPLKRTENINIAEYVYNKDGDVIKRADLPNDDKGKDIKTSMDIARPKSGREISDYLKDLQAHIDNFLEEHASIGARINRIELIQNRLDTQYEGNIKMLSDAEDADLAQVITDLNNEENVHRAALASGSRIIQPTLLDFLR